MKQTGIRIFALVLACALLTGCWGMENSSAGGMSSSAPSSPMTPSPTPDAGEDETYPEGDSSAEEIKDSSQPARAAAARPAQDWCTLLVNAEHPLAADFTVETVPVEGYEDRLFDARAVEDLNRMLRGAADAGLPLYLVSTYRSIERQTALYQRKVNFYLQQGCTRELAEQQAARWVAAPGTSEHNLGLAADIVSANWYSENDDLTEAFADTPEFAWLSEHCVEYGFVLRYPQGKTALTGVEYEPWHYRYVGAEAARYLTENGLCLEEL